MTRYISVAEYFWLAEQVTGTEAAVLIKSSRTELADSASHAPAAEFGGHEFHVDLIEKAAVLVCRLAWNHPLSDGNKRAAWAALVMFLDLNDVRWEPDPPNVDGAEVAMFAVAAHEVDEVWVADWLRTRTRVRETPDLASGS